MDASQLWNIATAAKSEKRQRAQRWAEGEARVVLAECEEAARLGEVRLTYQVWNGRDRNALPPIEGPNALAELLRGQGLRVVVHGVGAETSLNIDWSQPPIERG